MNVGGDELPITTGGANVVHGAENFTWRPDDRFLSASMDEIDVGGSPASNGAEVGPAEKMAGFAAT